jgi:POT family proton-dependent oligopeptide transporter
MLFLMGTPRYVRHPPTGDLFSSSSASSSGKSEIIEETPTIPLMTIFRISGLIVPFNIAYSQMATTFIVQGTVMQKGFGFIDAASMNNADAIAVLVFGHLVGSHFYPALSRRGIKIPTTYKFALGSALGALAIAWALLVEHMIHSTYQNSGERVSILWQSLSYVLIGAGEIFAVSAAYEVAFTASPPDKKALASALNLFCVGGIPNVLCIFLYNACRRWFRNSRGTTSIHTLEDYSSAHVYKYFMILFAISLLGIFVNLLPSVKDYVVSIEDRATDMVKTPVLKKRPVRIRRQTSSNTESSPTSDEESPMLRVKRHQAYLKCE